MNKDERNNHLLQKATLPSFVVTAGVTVIQNTWSGYCFLASEIEERTQLKHPNHSHFKKIGDIPK